MPEYIYTTKDGKSKSVVCTIAKRPKRVRIDGKWAYRDIAAEHRGMKSGDPWPIWSDGMGVHPDQIPELQALCAAHGVRVECDSMGRVKCESRGHRRKLMEIRGFHDKDGGYGDG